jgi:hypothetical protein
VTCDCLKGLRPGCPPVPLLGCLPAPSWPGLAARPCLGLPPRAPGPAGPGSVLGLPPRTLAFGSALACLPGPPGLACRPGPCQSCDWVGPAWTADPRVGLTLRRGGSPSLLDPGGLRMKPHESQVISRTSPPRNGGGCGCLVASLRRVACRTTPSRRRRRQRRRLATEQRRAGRGAQQR